MYVVCITDLWRITTLLLFLQKSNDFVFQVFGYNLDQTTSSKWSCVISLCVLSSRYYDLDAYHRKMMEKEKKKGSKTLATERTVFNDEEQRRYVDMFILVV